MCMQLMEYVLCNMYLWLHHGHLNPNSWNLGLHTRYRMQHIVLATCSTDKMGLNQMASASQIGLYQTGLGLNPIHGVLDAADQK